MSPGKSDKKGPRSGGSVRPATRAGSRADDQVQGQQAALPSEVRISRRRQDVRGNAIPDRQSLEVDRGNYEVGRRTFMPWSIWTILHLPFTGTSERPAAAVQVGDAIEWMRLNSDIRTRLPDDGLSFESRRSPFESADQWPGYALPTGSDSRVTSFPSPSSGTRSALGRTACVRARSPVVRSASPRG